LEQQTLQRALNKTLQFEEALCLLKLSEKPDEALKYILMKTPSLLCQTTEVYTHVEQHNVRLQPNKEYTHRRKEEQIAAVLVSNSYCYFLHFQIL
jgi:hypothetical protein